MHQINSPQAGWGFKRLVYNTQGDALGMGWLLITFHDPIELASMVNEVE